MEVILVAKANTCDENRTQHLAFLAAFLDDETVRNIPKNDERFCPNCAAFAIPRIKVGDYSAMELAQIFNFDDHPTKDWTPAQWAKLHEKVRAALKKEKLPDFGGKK